MSQKTQKSQKAVNSYFINRYLILNLILISIIVCSLVGCFSDLNDGNLPTREPGDGYILDPYSNFLNSQYDIDPDVNDQFDDITLKPGQVTAALWRDQDNYQYWLHLNDQFQTEHNQQIPKNEFANYHLNMLQLFNPYPLDTLQMLTVEVRSHNLPVSFAQVKIYHENNQELIYFESVTNQLGLSYLFIPKTATYPIIIEVTIDQITTTDLLTTYTPKVVINLEEKLNTNIPDTIDLAFLIDTTGSMSDELRYLQVELTDVITRLSSVLDATIRLALVFYQDYGCEYLTRTYDFTTNIYQQINYLKNEVAYGGFDFEEAVVEGFDEILGLSWSSTSTKLVFHVADAPIHPLNELAIRYAQNLTEAAKQGIRIIPVTCSGTNSWTEYLMRLEALITGGSYIYLTNDSGIGNGHIEPRTGYSVVEYLNELIIRVIIGYHTGNEPDPIPWRQTAVEEIVDGLESYVLINFDSQEGSAVKPRVVKVNSLFTNIPIPTREGYLFIGWYLNNTLFDNTSVFTTNVTLVARWSKIAS